MKRQVTTVIDKDLCIGCGMCVSVCPSETITMLDDKAVISGDRSIACGHCEAVCPVGAVRVNELSDETSVLSTLAVDTSWMPHGKFDTAELVRLMRSRRSCRNYKTDPVERPLLEDLVRIGISAPSGSNCQAWTFTVLPDRKAVEGFGKAIIPFFKKLNRTAENSLLRGLLNVLGKKELSDYYRDYYPQIEEKIGQWEESGRDWLFWGAPAAIVVGSRPGASCPAEDALLASGNILLAAHALGLGTCLIGFAVAAMKKDSTIKEKIGIPSEERVYAVIVVGYPDETYHALTRRKESVVRYFEG